MYLGASSLQGNAESNSDSAFSTRAHLSIGEQHLFSGPANRTKYSYDANGNRASLTEGGTTFGYVYDGQNRLKRADAFGGSLFFEYDAAGRRTALSRPNGIRTAYEYDDAGQLLSVTHAKGPSVVLGFSYGYDGHGMRTSKTRETGYREAYGYDAADRLVRVDYGTAKRVEYGLDLLGNRVLEDTTTVPSTGLQRNSATFNAFNQLTSSGGPGTAFPPTTNAWDLNGNLLTETKAPSGLPPEVATYGWDKDNRLRSVTPPIGSSTTYRYEPSGLRTERIDAGGTIRYLLEGKSVFAEFDATNASATRFLNHPHMIDETLAYQRGVATEYPLSDALGSIYAATDGDGAVVHRYDFEPYGKRTDLGGSTPPIDRGYTGREHDAWGGRYHRDRYAEVVSGRWNQADRVALNAGPNSYVYANGQPTRLRDATGQLPDIDPETPFIGSVMIAATLIFLEVRNWGHARRPCFIPRWEEFRQRFSERVLSEQVAIAYSSGVRSGRTSKAIAPAWTDGNRIVLTRAAPFSGVKSITGDELFSHTWVSFPAGDGRIRGGKIRSMVGILAHELAHVGGAVGYTFEGSTPNAEMFANQVGVWMESNIGVVDTLLAPSMLEVDETRE